MKNGLCRTLLASLVLAASVMVSVAQAGICEQAPLNSATINVDPKSGHIELKALTSSDLKQAIGYAAQHGDLDPKDAKELITKITDIETLMDQFDFIRDQERRMVGSLGGPVFH